MIRGKQVGVRPLQSDDAWILFKWFNDPRVVDGLGLMDPHPSVSLEQELEIVQEKIGKRSVRPFLLQDLDLDLPMGFAELSHIDMRNSSAKVFIMIGEPELFTDWEFQESLDLIVRIAFRSMNLHRLQVRVPVIEERTISLYQSRGFLKEGVLRHDHFRKGAYRDSVILSLLSEDPRGV